MGYLLIHAALCHPRVTHVFVFLYAPVVCSVYKSRLFTPIIITSFSKPTMASRRGVCLVIHIYVPCHTDGRYRSRGILRYLGIISPTIQLFLYNSNAAATLEFNRMCKQFGLNRGGKRHTRSCETPSRSSSTAPLAQMPTASRHGKTCVLS